MQYKVTDNKLWRKERLVKVEKIVAKFLNISVDQLQKQIVKLSDEKGQLFVVWEDSPTPFQRQCFMNAWWVCGEKEDFVQHIVPSKKQKEVGDE